MATVTVGLQVTTIEPSSGSQKARLSKNTSHLPKLHRKHNRWKMNKRLFCFAVSTVGAAGEWRISMGTAHRHESPCWRSCVRKARRYIPWLCAEPSCKDSSRLIEPSAVFLLLTAGRPHCSTFSFLLLFLPWRRSSFIPEHGAFAVSWTVWK